MLLQSVENKERQDSLVYRANFLKQSSPELTYGLKTNYTTTELKNLLE
jgi:hypothetical protein